MLNAFAYKLDQTESLIKMWPVPTMRHNSRRLSSLPSHPGRLESDAIVYAQYLEAVLLLLRCIRLQPENNLPEHAYVDMSRAYAFHALSSFAALLADWKLRHSPTEVPPSHVSHRPAAHMHPPGASASDDKLYSPFDGRYIDDVVNEIHNLCVNSRSRLLTADIVERLKNVRDRVPSSCRSLLDELHSIQSPEDGHAGQDHARYDSCAGSVPTSRPS